MKQATLLLSLLFLISTANSQISVRVKDSPRGREVDVQAKTKPSTKKETADNSSSSTPATADTATKPASNGSFDASYNGAAKVPLKSFWTHMDKIKAGTGTASSISNAERMIAQIKEKDPSYDVASLEAE